MTKLLDNVPTIDAGNGTWAVFRLSWVPVNIEILSVAYTFPSCKYTQFKCGTDGSFVAQAPAAANIPLRFSSTGSFFSSFNFVNFPYPPTSKDWASSIFLLPHFMQTFLSS